MAFTFFFRDEQVLELAARTLARQVMGRSKVHILNAGCAMGMETYTFAMLLAESMGKFALRNVKILAVDLDDEHVDFGKSVVEGRYHKDHLQRIPKYLFVKYFSPSENEDYFVVNNELRGLIGFQKYDLLTLRPLRCDFSMIICKNVLLHFKYQQRIDVLKMYYQMLLPDGLLVMENTQGMPDELSHKFKRVADYAQLYQRTEQ